MKVITTTGTTGYSHCAVVTDTTSSSYALPFGNLIWVGSDKKLGCCAVIKLSRKIVLTVKESTAKARRKSIRTFHLHRHVCLEDDKDDKKLISLAKSGHT